jgi:quinohemoprotein ethanol dehydrogenase
MTWKLNASRTAVAAAAGLIALAACQSMAGGGGGGGAANVDDARLVNAESEPGEWMSHGRTYSEQRFSPLDQINTDTVSDLGLAWHADLDTRRGQEATPLMVDGVIYVSTAWSKVYAFDAVTGEQLWEYDPEVPGEWGVNACCDVVNRGVAVWEGKVYVGTIDGRLIALDAKTGEPIWDVLTVDQTKPYSITGAPRIVKGKVLIGNGGAEFGVRGYVTAYDADTGAQAWRFYTVPGNPADGFENPILEMAAETWAGEWWRIGGGGTVWDSIVYDPETDLVYIGVGNGSPWNRALRSNGEGDNLFLTSIVALDPDDGSYVWHYQATPGESWDHTATQQIIVADLEIDGEMRHVLMQVPKNGFFYVLDAATGELISAKPVTELAWASGVDMATGRPIINPEARYEETGEPFLSTQNPNGVHDPETGLVYVPIHGTPFVYGAAPTLDVHAMATNLGTDFSGNATLDPDFVKENTFGRLIAWDPVNQREVWRVERAGQANGGALSTAGGLVFQGTGSGQFTALDATNGHELWSSEAQTGIIAAPMTYEIDGVQYVAIMVGTGSSWAMIGGDANMQGFKLPNVSRLLVYKLGGTDTLPETPPLVRPPMNPPPMTDALQAMVPQGAPLYDTFCGSCHGAGVVGVGLPPDLRRTPYLNVPEAFSQVVREGALHANGMAGFDSVMSEDDVQAIRAFIIMRANQDKGAE